MPVHPLDPLTEDEIASTTTLLWAEDKIGDSWRFASIELREPAKTDLLAWTPGDDVPRRSLSVVWDRRTNQTYEAVVDLVGGRVESFQHIPGVCPNFTIDEYHEVNDVLHVHSEVLERLAARGITDPGLVLFDVWTYGRAVMPEQWRDRRLGWCDVWLRRTPEGNPYAHPVAGLKIIVDMNSLEVLEIEDHHDHGLPDVAGEYDPALNGRTPRTDVRPLEITQPEGVSFTLDGHELRWQNWSLRLGFNYREGLILHQVAFDGRPIAHRMSFAEMVVPYRDASFDHYRRTAFDIGEWGLGFMTTSLELGCDCLGEIVYVDAVLNDTRGQPVVTKQAICLHEEDNAVLWKHVDSESGALVRRMRRMVISTHATVANYEYLVYWRLYADGNIECEIRATGLMVSTPLAEGQAAPATGTVVDERTYAPFHQHFLVAKLDLDIDGPDNTVVEVDSMAAPISASNPHGLDLHTAGTTIASEAQSGRMYSWEKQRTWKVFNPNRTNRHGAHPAYKLVPGGAIPSFFDPAAPVLRRAPVIGQTLWVTAHDDAERWPAGDYPTQSDGSDGITRWIEADAGLVDTDVVLWYVFGIHHITRVEDWPIMPADTVSFWLKPFGFFDQNPSLDAPGTGADGPEAHCQSGQLRS